MVELEKYMSYRYGYKGCAKCGYDGEYNKKEEWCTIRYVAAKEKFLNRENRWDTSDQEFLKCTCKCCGYAWYEETKGKRK